MDKKLVYRVFYKHEPVYDIYADGSVKDRRTGEVFEVPTKERMDEIYRKFHEDGFDWENLRSDRTIDDPPFENVLERRELRTRIMYGGQETPSGTAYGAARGEDVDAFSTLDLLGCAPKGTDVSCQRFLDDGVDYNEPYYDEIEGVYDENRDNIEVQYFGEADKPWATIDYDQITRDGWIY